MSSAFRSRRPNQSTLNSPVTSRIISSEPLSIDQAQLQLDSFINELENISQGITDSMTGSSYDSDEMTIASQSRYNGLDSSVLNQLKRVQRDLRGLPPVIAADSTSNSRSGTAFGGISTNTTVNKKIVFGDASAAAPAANKKIVFETEEPELVILEEEVIVEETPEVVEVQAEEADVTIDGKKPIDKEERKRLKKERRKEEKRLKAEQQ